MKDTLESVFMLILDFIAEILNLLDVAIPMLLMVTYRVLVIILLYSIMKYLEKLSQ